MVTTLGGAARVTRSQATTLVREVVRFALGIALTSVLGRGLSAADFGFVAFVGTLYALAQAALDLGSGALVAREIARDPARERPLLEAATAGRGILGLGAALIVAGVAAAEPDPSRRAWLGVVAASLPLLAPAVVGVAFQVRQDLGPPSALAVVLQAFAVALALALLGARAAPAALAATYVAREAAGPVVLWVLARTRHGVVLSPGVRARGVRRLFGGAAAQAAAVLLQTASFHAGLLVVKATRPDDDLGAYAAAARLVNPLLLFVGALAGPLLPVVAAGYAARRPAAARVVGRASALGLALGAAGFAAVVVAPRATLDLVYGAASAGVRAGAAAAATADVLAGLAAAFACVCVGAPATTALLADGGERTLRAAFAAGLVVNLAVLVGVAEGLPLSAAAFGYAASEAVVVVVALCALRARGAIVMPRFGVATALAAAGVVAGAGRFLPAAAPFAGAAVAAALVFGPPGRAFRDALRASEA